MRIVFRYTSLLLVSLLFVLTGNAQVTSISGKVKGSEGVLSAATVSIGNRSVLTNSKGEFLISVNPGDLVLTITHSGYKKYEQPIKVEEDQNLSMDFIMIPADLLDEIVLIGSRSQEKRSSLNSSVPVDVFSSRFLQQTGQGGLMQMLNFSAPSLNASRELLNESVTLRNLDPQHVLLTINGIRYHNQALIYGGALKGILGRGNSPNDLSSIPFAAIETVEILRDGAAAQLGSDAIAGVINFRLKSSTGKTRVVLNMGQYYKGDGEKISLDVYKGFELSKKGFISLASSILYRGPTYRGGIYDGRIYSNNKTEDDSMILARNFDRKKVIGNIGNIKQVNAGVLINGLYHLNNNTDLFGTITFNRKKLRRESEYRFPKNPNQVNLALFPDGFGPIGTPKTRDLTFIAGLKRVTKNKWQYDITSSFGKNKLISNIFNTNNASQSFLGLDAQTNFQTGKQIYSQLTNSINFSKNLPGIMNNINLFNIGYGLEWRWENFRTKAGEEASWSDPDSSFNIMTQPGSQGNLGIHPDDVINNDRNVTGAYIDIETEIKKRFLFNIASRYEYYTDYGGNIAGKLAMRYKLADHFYVRSSIGNGFRAPTLQQLHFKSLQNSFILGTGGVRIPATRGIFPYDHEVSNAFGIPSLTAEKSLNLSGGITGTFFKKIYLTVDAFWIRIKNRIVLTGTFDNTDPDVKLILDNLFIQTGKKVEAVQFFTNAINTRTKGIDIVLTNSSKKKKSELSITLAANFSRTKLFGNIKTTDMLKNDSVLFNAEERERLEKGQPNSKIILNLNYKTGKFSFNIRNTRFGKTNTTTLLKGLSGKVDTLYESFSAKILTDVSLSYPLKPWLTITAGGNNIFNIYPDRLKNYGNSFEGRLIFSPEASPFGFNGGYYYVNMSFKF